MSLTEWFKSLTMDQRLFLLPYLEAERAQCVLQIAGERWRKRQGRTKL